jgi:organic hydroperoxide reductase OsmC/OhrA
MSTKHIFNARTEWKAINGAGTTDYKSYTRNHIISAKGKSDILASSDPVFRGDKTRYNPEELLVASLSSCHMLWYLHLCADAGVVVIAYEDEAAGTMTEDKEGNGQFKEVILHPVVTVKGVSMTKMALELHKKAHQKCFIANSCNFPVRHKPVIRIV